MASLNSTHATISVGQLSNMTDCELREYIQKHRRPNGNYHLPVQGWNGLSRDERLQLADRLKCQQKILSRGPSERSDKLDLDKLDARLGQVAADNDASSQCRPETTERPNSTISTVSFDYTEERKIREAKNYHNLIKDNGRPLYPIDQLDKVFENPENYRQLLRPWRSLGACRSHDRILECQWVRWSNFRKWQNDNRGLEDDDGGYQAFVEQQMRLEEGYCHTDRYIEFLAELEADPSCLSAKWESKQQERRRHRDLHRERGCKGFHDYAMAVQDRLKRHNFTLPFELNEDPKKQDQWTTWVEYLGYETWWLDKYSRSVSRLKPAHDEDFQELVDAKVVKDDETSESIRSLGTAIERSYEKEEAQRLVRQLQAKMEKLKLSTHESGHLSIMSKSERASLIRSAQTKLRDATVSVQWLKEREQRVNKFVRSTRNYVDALENQSRHIGLVNWVYSQVQAIEAEMGRSRESGTKASGKKRKLIPDDGSPEERRLKKHKLDQPESDHDTATLAHRRHAHLKKSFRIRRPQPAPNSNPAQAPERHQSKRIVANTNRSSAAVAPPTLESESGAKSKITRKKRSRIRAKKDGTEGSTSKKRRRQNTTRQDKGDSRTALGELSQSSRMDWEN